MRKIFLCLLWFAGYAYASEPQLDHIFGPNSVAFSPDAKRLAVAGSDGVKIYESATGRVLETRKGSSFGTYSVAWSRDGKSLVAGGLSATDKLRGEVVLWRVNQPERRWLLDQSRVTSLRFSRNGRYLWSATAGNWQGEKSGGSVRMWDAQAGTLLKTLAHYPSAWEANFIESTDGKNVICRVSVPDNEKVLKFDLETGATFGLPVEAKALPSYSDGKNRAEISTYSGADYSRFLYTVTNTQKKRIVSQDMGNVWGSAAQLKFPYVAAIVSQRYFPGYEARLKIWKIDAKTWKLQEISSLNRTLAPSYLTSTPNGKEFFIQSNKGVLQLDASTLAQKKLWLESKERTVQFPSKALSVSQSGARIFNNRWLELIGGKPHEVVSDEKLSGVVSSVGAVSPDGKFLVTRYKSGVAVYDERGKALELLTQAHHHAHPLKAIDHLLQASFSPDGQQIAIVSGWKENAQDTSLHLFRRNGKNEGRFIHGKEISGVRNVVFSPDSSRLFLVSIQQSKKGGKQIVLSRFNVKSGLKEGAKVIADVAHLLNDEVIRDVIISPDGKNLALSAFVMEGIFFRPRALIFESETLKQKTSLPIGEAVNVLQIGNNMAFDSDNNLAILSGQRLEVWNLRTRKIEKSRFLS